MIFQRPSIPQHKPDWPRLVSLDFETYYDTDYTLRKMSTSEYIRDPRFKAQMVGIKIGRGKTKVYTAKQIKTALASINWATHSLLCHNVQFDAFILSHHYKIHPKFLYDTLSMARGLHSNDIGAGLDEVSVFYGGHGKIEGALEQTLGVLDWSKELNVTAGAYCANDVDEMYRIFTLMLPQMPADEIDIIDMVCKMFTSPKLRVDIPRVETELKRELAHREKLMYEAVNPLDYDIDGKLYDKSVHSKLLKGRDEKALTGVERDMQIIKRIIGSNNLFADLLEAEGVELPTKISPAWMKRSKEDRESEEGLAAKYAFAFAKDDIDFVELPNRVDGWGFDLNKPADVEKMVAKQKRLQDLVNVRIAVKSTTNITRAQRFLTAGANGLPLPCGYAYSRAHTHRLGGQNKMNMQNLTRGGELRLSILAPPGHVLCVQDSGQIEARVNGWLWGQHDLLDAFQAADNGTGRDAYCNFGDRIYGRTITKADKMERHVGKVCVLGLGFQMGAAKLQLTLAKGALGGPPVYFSLDQCKKIIDTYRGANYRIVEGWNICKRIIEEMSAGVCGSHGPLNWEKDCIWLPNGMRLHYPDLRQSTNDENGWTEWSYQAKDLRKKIYGGLLCLGASTQVLTDNGWKSIVEVRLGDKLWDGTNWVSHSGLIYRGVKETINFGGIDMTPDHEVLVDEQWIAAEETTHHEATSSFTRHYWAPARHDDSAQSDRQRWSPDAVENTVPVRELPDFVCVGIPEGHDKELRMLNGPVHSRVENISWDVAPSGLFSVAQYVGPLQATYASVVGAVRWARNHSLSAMDRLSGVLVEYAGWVCAGFGLGQEGQLVRVLPKQLSLGHTKGEHSEHPRPAADQYPRRADAALASSRSVGHRKDDVALPAQPRLAGGTHVRQARLQEQEVFDLVDAGPLKRFTVRGDDGQPFIVHNCENIVQALARIIVMTQTLAISRKYPVVMTTHDEAVALAKKAQGQRCIDFMARCMKTPPSWCADIPLNCEGGFDVNYSK